MDFKEVITYWKSLLTFIVVVVSTTIAVIAWAGDQKQLIKAEQALIHNEYYQENRIARKRDQVRESERELSFLEEYIGDDEPTPREARKIEALINEIRRLEVEIEEIEVELNTEDE